MTVRLGPGTIIVVGNNGFCDVGYDERGKIKIKIETATIYRPGDLGLEQTLLVHKSWRKEGFIK